MKKRIYLLIIIIIGISISILLISSFKDKSIFETYESVSMVIKEGTLTSKGATLIITDKSGNDISFGEWYNIYRFVDEKWKKLDYIIDEPIAWSTMGYLPDNNGILEMDVNWEPLYGNLEPGRYRIVKKANQKYIFTEFDVV